MDAKLSPAGAAGASQFRRVLAAEVVSNFGSMLSRLAIPWLAALVLDATPLQMGFLVIADVAAAALSTLVIGALVDRAGKRATMLATDIARAGVLGALAALAWAEALAFWMLVAAAAASGMLTAAFEMARSAWMAQRVPTEELPTRNAQLAAGMSVSETVAFALGGWIYQGLGALIALAVDAASYLVSALFLRRVEEAPPSPVTADPPGHPLRALLDEARAGLAAIAARPVLRTLALLEALIAFAMSLAGTSYMIFVARDLAFDPGVLGMIFATGGVGSLVGAALAPRLGRVLGPGHAMLVGLVLLAIGAACIPLAPAAGIVGAALLVAHQVVGDGGHTVFMVHDRTLRQTVVGAELLARVDAGIRTVGQLGQLAGALGGGLFATALGARPALVVSAGLLALAALVLASRPVRV